MRTSRLLPLAVALVLLASSAAPQEPPVFGARADLVVIDLIATDGEQVPQRDHALRAPPRRGGPLGRKALPVHQGGLPQTVPGRIRGAEGARHVEIASTASLPKKGRFQLWTAAHHSAGRLAVASSPLEAQ